MEVNREVEQNTDQLVVRLLGNVVQRVRLTEEVLTLGRTPDNGLPLPHPLVSRRHAEIRHDPSGLLVTDLGSSNGTYFGQTRLPPNQPRPFPPGETLSIGPFEITYEPARVGEGEEAAAALVEEPPAAASSARPPLPPPRPLRPPRPSYPALVRSGPLSRYLRYLPVVYHDADFLGRYLLIMESIWEALEERQDHVEMYFDPRTCPPGFLPWLARWIDLPLDTSLPEWRQRQAVAAGMEVLVWRGTAYGLARAVEASTGLGCEVEEMPDQPYVVRVRVRLPADGADATREQVEAVVRTHKPAHAGYVLEVES